MADDSWELGIREFGDGHPSCAATFAGYRERSAALPDRRQEYIGRVAE